MNKHTKYHQLIIIKNEKKTNSNYVLNETTWPLVGSVDGNARLTFSTDFVTIVDGDIVTKSFFLSVFVLSILVKFNRGDDGVRVRAIEIVVSLWLLIDEFVHWNISRNSRRNNDDVAE